MDLFDYTTSIGLVTLFVGMFFTGIFAVASADVYPEPWTARAKFVAGCVTGLGGVILLWPLVAAIVAVAIVIGVPGWMLRKYAQ